MRKKYLYICIFIVMLIAINIAYGIAGSRLIIARNIGPADNYPYSDSINSYMAVDHYIYNPSILPVKIVKMDFIHSSGIEEVKAIVSDSQFGFIVNKDFDDIERLYSQHSNKLAENFIVPTKKSRYFNICYKITNEDVVLPIEVNVRFKVLFFTITKKIKIQS